MLYSTKGIVLHQFNYAENSVIAKIYTELFGLQSYLVKGVKKEKSKIKSGWLQHLSLLELVVYHKEKNTLQHIKEMRNISPFQSIPFDIKKSSIALFINEVLLRSIKEEERNKELFDFLFNSIQLLDLQHEQYTDFHLVFMMQLTKHLGFSPHNNYNQRCNIFDLSNGCFCQETPPHPYYMDHSLSILFDKLINCSFESTEKTIFTTEQRNQLIEKLIEYYQLHLPAFKEIKSHHILQEVLN